MKFKVNYLGNFCKIGPGISFLFGKNELGLKGNLKGPNRWKSHILIGFVAKILILSGLDGYKLIRNDIALNKNIIVELLLKIVFY